MTITWRDMAGRAGPGRAERCRSQARRRIDHFGWRFSNSRDTSLSCQGRAGQGIASRHAESSLAGLPATRLSSYSPPRATTMGDALLWSASCTARHLACTCATKEPSPAILGGAGSAGVNPFNPNGRQTAPHMQAGPGRALQVPEARQVKEAGRGRGGQRVITAAERRAGTLAGTAPPSPIARSSRVS